MADENSVLDGLLEVFPEVDFSTLIEVSIQFKDDIDMAGDYIIQNVLPNILPDPHGHQQEFNDTSTQIGRDPVDNSTISDSVQFDQTNNEKEGGPTAKQLKQSLTGLCPEVCDVPSTSGQSCTFEDFMFNRVSFQLDASSERNPISASGGDRPLHDDGSPDVNICSSYSVGLESVDNVIADEDCQLSSQRNPISASQGDGSLHDDGSPSSYSVNLESLDDVIASEHYKKNALMSNVAAISEMLQEVELNEENTKRAISEASQAGNDILVKVEELKELTTLAVEDNKKAAGEIFAEKSILATEARELQTRLVSISEETKSFMLTIDAMHNTLQRRLADAEVERVAAEKSKLEREASAHKSLKEKGLSLEAAKNHSKRLEQQAQENAKLRELLTDRGHAVDALHGEMLGIFDSVTQLKLRVDMQLPVDEQWQHVSSRLSSSPVDEPAQVPLVLSSSAVEEPLQQIPPILSSSAVGEPMQQVSPILSGSAFDEQLQQVSSILSSSAFDESLLAFDEPLQLVSSRLSSSVRSARSDGSLTESFASKSSWSSAAESNVSLMDDERIAKDSVGDFALDDSWDVVDDQDTVESPATVLKGTPMLL